MRWRPLTHLTEKLFSFSLGFFCDYVPCQAFSFCLLTRSNADQSESLSGLTTLWLLAFPCSFLWGEMERWKCPQDHPEEMGTALSHSHFHWQGRTCRLLEQMPFMHDAKFKEKRIYLFNIWRYKVKKPKNQNSFSWWAQMHPRSSNTCISTTLLPVLIWLPHFWKKSWGIDLLKGLLIFDLCFESPSGPVLTQGML